MLRKKHGKTSQRRKYLEESSAPKRRKLDHNEGYKEQRGTSGDNDGRKMEKRSLEETAKEDMPSKRRKTQTVMERYLVGKLNETHVDGVASVSDKTCAADDDGGTSEYCNKLPGGADWTLPRQSL